MAAKSSTDDTGTATELTESTAIAGDAQLPHHSFLNRLYTGTGAFEVVGRRRLWYAVSGAIFALSIAAILIRGFSFGIDFEGGTTVSFPRGDAEVAQVTEVFTDTVGFAPEAVVEVGSGGSRTIQIRSQTLDTDQTAALKTALFDRFQPVGEDGQPSASAISDSAVSETWGGQITKKAMLAIVVFLVLVAIYIAARYERYMAISALASMVFDLVVTAGVYAAIGFEVTPATVIGWLTILGFSIYDTVIVFDKVEENTHGFQHTTRRTYAEQANLAVNQTFMRSINTSVIAVLPVIALMVVAVWLLGVGMLKDLALVQLVGIIVGTYSSIYFATPLLVSMRERTELVRNHTRKVLKRRQRVAGAPAVGDDTTADQDADDAEQDTVSASTRAASTDTEPAADKPAPGARPVRPTRTRQGRPSGKRR